MKCRFFSAFLVAFLVASQTDAAPPTMKPSTSSTRSQSRFALRDSDRVVFYGDSITEHRFYTMFVETFVLTRFPKWRVRFFNAGWGGDKVTGGPDRPIDLRLSRDVIALQPSVVTVMLGMNDGGWRAFDERLFAEYQSGYRHILDVLQQKTPQSRITVLWPSPFDDVTQTPRFEGGYNRVLERYGEWIQQTGLERDLTVANLNTPVVQALARAKAMDAALSQKIMGDRAHPSPAGHLLMALSLLEAWRAPSVVSDLRIDAKAARATRIEQTRVTQITRNADEIAWMQRDESLPFPIERDDAATALALRASSFDAMLNNQWLRVTNQDDARYLLKIDGESVGEWTASQLKSGVNLALLDTPMTRQAQGVHDLTTQRNRVRYTLWRHVQLPLADIKSSKYRDVLRALGNMENDLILRQRAAAQPKSRLYQLKRLEPATEAAR